MLDNSRSAVHISRTMTRTRLQKFMKRHRINDVALAQASGKSLRQVVYLRNGQKVPTLPTIVAIRQGCRALTGKPVDVTDLFDFEKAS